MAHTETIGTGETYTTIQGWEDGRDGVLDGVETGECKGEVFASVVFNGASSDSSNYLHLTAQSGAEHDGRAHEVSAAGNARIEHNANSDCIGVFDEYTRISWMEVKGPGNYGVSPIEYGAIGTCTQHLHHCIFHNNNAGGGSSQRVIFDDSDGEFRVYRNIFYGIDAMIYIIACAANSCLYNNTVYKCDLDSNYAGIFSSQANLTVKSCAVFSNPNGDLTLSNGTYDNIATSDATGDDDLDNLTAADQFNDISNDYSDTDLLLKTGSDLISVGDDFSALTGTFPEIDISIDDRGGSSVSNWDIGASEFISGGSTLLPKSMNTYLRQMGS